MEDFSLIETDLLLLFIVFNKIQRLSLLLEVISYNEHIIYL